MFWLTSDEDLYRHRRLAFAKRRVWRTDVASLVSSLDGPNEQRPFKVDLATVRSVAAAGSDQPWTVVVVHHQPVLRPQDDGHRRVGVDWAVDAAREAPGKVDSRRQTGHTWQVYNNDRHCDRQHDRTTTGQAHRQQSTHRCTAKSLYAVDTVCKLNGVQSQRLPIFDVSKIQL